MAEAALARPSSRFVDVDGPVYVSDFGGSGPSIVLLHGLGGSHVNWLASGPLLARSARVVAIDLVAFGLTPPDGRSSTVHANAELLRDFINAEMGGSAIVIGNSMGGLVSLIAAAEYPEQIAGLVLLDSALPRPEGAGIDRAVAFTFAAYAMPGFGEMFLRARALRYGPERYVHQVLKLCCADVSRVAPEVVEAHVELARERRKMPWVDRTYLDAARSLLVTLASKRRFYASVDSITAPALILQGARDRLVPVEAARALARRRPDWELEIYDDAGHAPQLEIPERFVASVQRWLKENGKAAAIAATG
ncbi:MAG TPA: alpha/beta hydrolase [Actinomycetota bacterium]|nr:alpha/beta hydrolase [Actinomycetota bacterium]